MDLWKFKVVCIACALKTFENNVTMYLYNKLEWLFVIYIEIKTWHLYLKVLSYIQMTWTTLSVATFFYTVENKKEKGEVLLFILTSTHSEFLVGIQLKTLQFSTPMMFIIQSISSVAVPIVNIWSVQFEILQSRVQCDVTNRQ